MINCKCRWRLAHWVSSQRCQTGLSGIAPMETNNMKNSIKSAPQVIITVVLSCCLSMSVWAAESKYLVYPAVDSYEDIFTGVDAAREQALAEGKLLLYIMGADWCHDSTDFVTKTQRPEFRALIAQRYVVHLINVGYLTHVREIINYFGEPVIYGTPTVLVVEPESRAVLNADSLSHWRNSSLYSDEDTVDYFSSYSPGMKKAKVPAAAPALAAALAEIDQFEQEQAERIYLAYAELGGLMASMGTDEKPGQDFVEKWKQLAGMRSQITVDLSDLRAEAQRQAETGQKPIKLSFPAYSLFVD